MFVSALRVDGSLRLIIVAPLFYGTGNPFNTYRHRGLPPTPIALPGEAAIRAAVHPAEGSALYFVARGDGSHEFSETLEQHIAAVRQFQLRRREDYRSSPAPAQEGQ